MAIIGKSARGEEVDFDILHIKQQLASKPVVIGVNERRNFIDNKDGIKTNKTISTEPRNALQMITPSTPSSSPDLGDILAVSVSAAKDSVVFEEKIETSL